MHGRYIANTFNVHVLCNLFYCYSYMYIAIATIQQAYNRKLIHMLWLITYG